jgi:hypothetical protein
MNAKRTTTVTPEQQERLRVALTTGSRLGASDVRLINLDVYRRRLGAQWYKYKAIINSYAHAAMEGELGENDFIVPTKSGYAVFFFDKDMPEILSVSNRISAKLDERLAADEIFGDPPLTCTMAPVDCATLLKQLDAEQSIGCRASWQPIEAETAGEYPNFYAPLWNARVERILGSIHVLGRAHTIVRRPDRDYYAPDPARAQEDIRAFNAMLTDVYKLSKAGHSATVFFSLNFKTFCLADQGEKYLHALRQTPASLLKYLTPRFVRIPPGTPQSVLASKVQMLTPIFKHVALHTSPSVDSRSFGFVGCSIISTSWSEIERLAGKVPLAARRLAGSFASAARSLRVNGLVDGVDSPSAFEAVVDAGLDFVSGAAICPPDRAPWTQVPLTLGNVRCGLNAAASQQIIHV